ncbi:MAG: GAP family protein [Solirubrobacterales bacterium]|nr:GAP family protein [Solirubrobacterales bacterium]MBV9916254.1 GAP family protein [Solirubrobacterales bacterium]
MNRDLVTVLTLAVVATVNPSLLAAVTLMLLLPNPKRLLLGYLLGAYTTSVVAGLAIVFSLHGTGTTQTSSHVLSPAGEVVVGAVALTVALLLARGRDEPLRNWRRQRKARKASKREPKDPWQTRMLQRGSVGLTFVVGAAMSFPGVGYVNALDHIAHLNPSVITVLLLVAYFCVMQQILLEGALIATVFAPARTQHAIVRFKAWFTGHGRQLAMLGLTAIGALLTVRGLLTLS